MQSCKNAGRSRSRNARVNRTRLLTSRRQALSQICRVVLALATSQKEEDSQGNDVVHYKITSDSHAGQFRFSPKILGSLPFIWIIRFSELSLRFQETRCPQIRPSARGSIGCYSDWLCLSDSPQRADLPSIDRARRRAF